MDNESKPTSNFRDFASKDFIGKLITKTEVVPNTFELTFEFQQDYDFLPGQYCWLQFPQNNTNQIVDDRRAFSLIRSTNNRKTISVTFRKSESKFKTTLLNSPIGTEMIASGPRGNFVLNDIKTPVVFIAGGVGITPFMSMIEYLNSTENPRKTVLFISNKENDDRIYTDKIQTLVKDSTNLNVYELIGDKLSWGYIEKALEKYSMSPIEITWYISGPSGLVSSVFDMLVEQSIAEDKIILDEFKPHIEEFATLENLTKESITDGLFRIALENFGSHVIITDPEGRIVYANRAAETVTGFSKTEMYGKTPRLWGGLMNPSVYKTLWDTIKGERKQYVGELINKRKNGQLYNAIVNITPIVQPDGTLIGYIATEFDVTDTKSRENKLQEKIAEYEKLNKLMVDREIRMVELKKQVMELEGKKS